MRLFLGVTDGEWYEHQRALHAVDEVNFWQPSGNQHFRALSPGQPFLFKLHSPENFTAGGGYFQHFSIAR